MMLNILWINIFPRPRYRCFRAKVSTGLFVCLCSPPTSKTHVFFFFFFLVYLVNERCFSLTRVSRHLLLGALEILKCSKLGIKQGLNIVTNRRTVNTTEVIMERPEFLESIEWARLVVEHCELFKIAIDGASKSLFQAVAIESEQALQTIVIVMARVFFR